MKKRVVSWLLTGILAVSMLTGCGDSAKQDNGGSAETEAAAKTQAEGEGGNVVNGIDISEPYEATMVLTGSQQANQQMVLDKINEILMRDINTKMDIVMLSMGDFTTQLPLMLQGGDKVDLVPVINSFAGTFINNKMVLDLSGYVEQYGVNMKEAFADMGEELLYTGCINDFMFGIPVVKGSSGVSTICMRADWLEEAGFTREDIKGVEDMDRVYEKVYANHPEAIMMWMTKGNTADSRYEVTDPLTDYNGVLLNYGEKPEVVDLTSSSYTFNQGWELPNQFRGGIWEGNDPDLWEKNIEATKSAKHSCALGFAYDSSALSTEIAALSNIKSQYIDSLNTGAVDPSIELPKFLEELDNAGMQKVIEEKQAQLDAWYASK